MKTVLNKYLNTNRLSNSWLIKTDNIDLAYDEIVDFVSQSIINGIFEHNSYVIEGDEAIKIEEIRLLKQWVYKTSSDAKIAIIKNAENMNINSANCCLKFMEDTPNGTYIFLISKAIGNIPITIKSRCVLISHDFKHSESVDKEEYNLFVKEILLEKNFEHLSIKNIENDLDIWRKFKDMLLYYYIRCFKNSLGLLMDVNKEEKILFSISPLSLKSYDLFCSEIAESERLDMNKKYLAQYLVKNFIWSAV